MYLRTKHTLHKIEETIQEKLHGNIGYTRQTKLQQKHTNEN